MNIMKIPLICRFSWHSFRGVINQHGALQWIVCARCGIQRNSSDYNYDENSPQCTIAKKIELIQYFKKIQLMSVRGKTEKISSLKCFWTYPFGHIWHRTEKMSSYDRICYICGEKSTKGNYDGNWFRDLGVLKEKTK